MQTVSLYQGEQASRDHETKGAPPFSRRMYGNEGEHQAGDEGDPHELEPGDVVLVPWSVVCEDRKMLCELMRSVLSRLLLGAAWIIFLLAGYASFVGMTWMQCDDVLCDWSGPTHNQGLSFQRTIRLVKAFMTVVLLTLPLPFVLMWCTWSRETSITRWLGPVHGALMGMFFTVATVMYSVTMPTATGPNGPMTMPTATGPNGRCELFVGYYFFLAAAVQLALSGLACLMAENCRRPFRLAGACQPAERHYMQVDPMPQPSFQFDGFGLVASRL